MKASDISTWIMHVAKKNNLVLDVAALHFQTLKINRFCYVAKRQILLNSLHHQMHRLPLDSLAVIHRICVDFDFYNVFNGNTFDQHTVFVLSGWNAGVPSQDPDRTVDLFSTCNCLLDFVCLQCFQEHSRGVNLQMDHVFKVKPPSLSISICYRHPFSTSCCMI